MKGSCIKPIKIAVLGDGNIIKSEVVVVGIGENANGIRDDGVENVGDGFAFAVGVVVNTTGDGDRYTMEDDKAPCLDGFSL
ncbi:hypothetical protein Tco_1538177 [Tanacetum coccineum]